MNTRRRPGNQSPASTAIQRIFHVSIVKQEVLDRADLAVARLDRATYETTHGEQHGLSLLKHAQSAARPGVDR